jgi:energy-coupling factor transport system permease protein
VVRPSRNPDRNATHAEAKLNAPDGLHALTWGWWALAAVATIQIAPSPTYVILVVLIAALVVEVHGRGGRFGATFKILVMVAAAFVVLRVVLAAVTAPGAGPVWFTLPQVDLPALLGGFALGGPVHAHVVLRAAAEGLVIVGVVAAFGAFNAVVSHHELVRTAPRAFHEVGLVVTVALAFVPSVVASVAAVREADRARTGGRTVRRRRLLRLVLPVVESGMERAMHLADSMDARGFAHGGPSDRERTAGWLSLGALLALGAGFAALVGREAGLATLLGVIGGLLLVLAIAVASSASARPRYRVRRPGRVDAVVALAVTAAPVGVGLTSAVTGARLAWDVTTQPLPGFEPLAAIAILALALPAAIRVPVPHPVPEQVPVR